MIDENDFPTQSELETIEQSAARRPFAERQPGKTPPVGEVPGYRLEKRLGSGSYGEVWRAVQENTGRRVAIKFFSGHRGLDWPHLKREVGKLVEVLSERRVVHLLQVGWDANPPYYVMEYLPGGSLEHRLTRGPLPVGEVVEAFREVAEALVYLHGKAILHCDLKPANVLLDDHGQIRLADFGQARLSSDAGPALGTLFYMAPEQTEPGARPDVRSDIYSLGALAYCMLTGEPPYATERANKELKSSGSTQERIERYRQIIETSPFPAGHRQQEGVDRAFASVIDRCLQRQPSARFETVHQIIDALQARDRQRTQRPLIVFGVLGPLVLLFAMAGVGLWAWYQSESQARRLVTEQNLASSAGYAELITAVVDRNLSAVQRSVEREAGEPELRRRLLAVEMGSRRSARIELQSYLDGIYENYRDRFFFSWVVSDQNAVVLGRSPFDEVVVGHRYAYREWFTGLEDVPPETVPPIAIARETTGLTLAFESTATGNPMMVSIASPIERRGAGGTEVIGVLGATLHLETFNEWLADAEGGLLDDGCPARFAILLNRGQLVRHPCPAAGAPSLPLGRDLYFEQPAVQALIGSASGRTEEFQDPLRPEREQMAVRDRFVENPEWMVLVSQSRSQAMSPIVGLSHQFRTLGWIAGGVGLVLIGGLWILLYRVTTERGFGSSEPDLIELHL